MEPSAPVKKGFDLEDFNVFFNSFFEKIDQLKNLLKSNGIDITEKKYKTLLLFEKQVLGKTLKEVFKSGKGLIFYRCIYVEQLINLLEKLEEPIKSELKRLIEYFKETINFPSYDKLKENETPPPINLARIEIRERNSLSRTYLSTQYGKKVGELTPEIIQNKKKLKLPDLKNAIQRRGLDSTGSKEVLRQRLLSNLSNKEGVEPEPIYAKKIVNDLTGKPIYDVAKLIFGGYQKPFNKTIVFTKPLSSRTPAEKTMAPKEYEQQHYSTLDDFDTVKQKIMKVLTFLKENDSTFEHENPELLKSLEEVRSSNDAKTGVEGNENFNILIPMLKFLDKPLKESEKFLGDISGLASLEMNEFDELTKKSRGGYKKKRKIKRSNKKRNRSSKKRNRCNKKKRSKRK